MAVKLEYYQIDPASKVKTKITNALSFGNMFKGTNKKIPIAIFNAGDTEAVSPTVSIKEYPDMFLAYQKFGTISRWQLPRTL